MEQSKNKKTMLTIIGIAILLIGLVGVTYAFFNYTRTGSANTIRVGRINFVTRQTNTINLTNLFPIDPTDSTAMNDNTKVGTLEIEIEGDTDYSDGVEYLVSAVNSNITVNGKVLPISLDVTVTTLGTESDSYYTARNSKNATIYKKLVGETLEGNQQILVGYIKPNTTSGTAEGVDGSITIKAYLDKNKILISDTYNNGETPTDNLETPASMGEGKTVFTTGEWNVLQQNGVSFKVKVEANEGIWVEQPTLYTQIIKGVDTTTQIDFSNTSGSGNGEGLYILSGTENDTNPIYYYRGAVTDNNVIFGDYCWQIVRTTDTGGIKMIYNGKPDILGSGNNITYNCDLTRNFQTDVITSVYLSDSTGYYYADDYEIVSITGHELTYRLKSKANPITKVVITSENDAQSNIPTIVANYPYTCQERTSDGTCKRLYKIDSFRSGVYANAYEAADISIIGYLRFNSDSTSLSDVGYMYNARYAWTNEAGENGAIYGKNVEWDGSNYLVIEDTAHTASLNTTKDNDHHYSCGTAGTTSCTSVRYYFYNYNYNYYITLTGGELVEDALYKMTGNIVNENIDVVTRNQGYVLNQNDSIAKAAVESWFRTNLTNEVDTNKRNYVNYLEDTIFCNDRSINTLGGWNPNGGSGNMFFGTHNRYGWSGTEKLPSFECPNETDRFSVGSSVAHLNYPVGLLTADEIVMAGSSVYGNNNITYYLVGMDYLWSMSPFSTDIAYSKMYFEKYGRLGQVIANGSQDLRPVISLKPRIGYVAGGDGTPTNPYVVKYE